ncbi:MAG: hypothetical protein RLZZ584_2356 [Pseudomonadota bacterium]
MRRDGSQTRQRVKLGSPFLVTARSVGPEALEPNHRLLHIPEGAGDEVIVGERITTGAEDAPSLIARRLNTVTGRTSSLSHGSPPHVVHWLFDPRGEPRLVLARHLGREAVHWRAAASDTWRQLAEAAYFELPFFPAHIDTAGTLYVITTDDGPAGTSVLRRFDFTAGRPETDALISARGFDVHGRIVSETVSGRALGVRLVTDAETTVWFDKRLAALQIQADQLADALAWAVERGHVDAGRVCIAGASYGGYATLMGLVRHPELYRCGIAWAAVADLRLLYKWRIDSDSTSRDRGYSYPQLVVLRRRRSRLVQDRDPPGLRAPGRGFPGHAPRPRCRCGGRPGPPACRRQRQRCAALRPVWPVWPVWPAGQRFRTPPRAPAPLKPRSRRDPMRCARAAR